MASYAELQPMPPEWPEALRIEMPDAALRTIALHFGSEWLAAFVELAVKSGNGAAEELICRVASGQHRAVVDFCLAATTLDDPPTQVVRWAGDHLRAPKC